MSELDQAVRAVVRDCLGVREGEDVLVVCNPATQGLGERLRAEAQSVGAEGVLSVMAERASHAAEPPAPIGGTVQVPVHLDCLVTKPDITVDGELVVRNGVLVV